MWLLHGLLLAFVSTSQATCPPDTTYNENFDKCYKYYSIPQPFLAAEKQCNLIGGNLAAIEAGYENNYVFQFAAKAAGQSINLWIGANLQMSTSWSWTYNITWFYTNWAPGQPGAGYPCGLMRSQDAMWRTAACNTALQFVCTVEPNASQPGRCPDITPPPVPTCPPAPCPRDASCSPGYSLYDGNCMCYKFLASRSNFTQSIDICTADNATLAKIDSADLNYALFSSSQFLCCPWIGLQCSNSSISSCHWLDDSVPVYTNFANANPVKSYGAYYLRRDGEWATAPSHDYTSSTLCQKPAIRTPTLTTSPSSPATTKCPACPTCSPQPAPACPTAPPSCSDDSVCPFGYELYAENCMCYKEFNNGFQNFITSSTKCADDNADLVKIDSLGLNNFLTNILVHEFGCCPWIGLQCTGSSKSSCHWMDGSVPTYTNFSHGGPQYGAYYMQGDGEWANSNDPSNDGSAHTFGNPKIIALGGSQGD